MSKLKIYFVDRMIELEGEQVKELIHASHTHVLNNSNLTGFGDTRVKKTERNPCQHGLYILMAR